MVITTMGTVAIAIAVAIVLFVGSIVVVRHLAVHAVPVVLVATALSVSQQQLEGNGVWSDVVFVFGIEQEAGHLGVYTLPSRRWRVFVVVGRRRRLEPQFSELVGLAVVEVLG